MTKGKTVNYSYYWQYVCAFTKWIPTNQFLHAKKVYRNDGSMTLERFGFIGTNRECFWGMTGVKWVTPLKVEQIIPPKHKAKGKKGKKGGKKGKKAAKKTGKK